MALIIGNHRLYTMTPVLDDAGNLVDWRIRVNRDIVDDVTGDVRTGMPTSKETSVWHLLTANQWQQVAGFVKEVQAALPNLDYEG